jgi:autophagy-related protein 9
MHPWKKGFTFWNLSVGMYLLIFSAYWLYNLAHLFMDLRAAAGIRHFTTHKLGLSERQLQTVTWPEVATRIVQVLPLLPLLPLWRPRFWLPLLSSHRLESKLL